MRILSDLHLGHRVSRIAKVESLRPLLEGAGTVIFNGDTWQELAKGLKARSGEMLAELKALCREVGCEAVFLRGNHDPGWEGPGFVELVGGKIVVTHGDGLLYDGSPWKREILKAGDKIDAIWAAHPRAETDVEERLQVSRKIAEILPSLTYASGRKIWQRAWDAMMPPQRGIEMLKAWWTQECAGEQFCQRYFPVARFLVIGHFHWGGTWQRGNLRVINTGSFLNPGSAYWVEISDGWLSYGRVDEKDGNCRKGRVRGRWACGSA